MIEHAVASTLDTNDISQAHTIGNLIGVKWEAIS